MKNIRKATVDDVSTFRRYPNSPTLFTIEAQEVSKDESVCHRRSD